MGCLIPRRIINPHYKKIANENNEPYSNYEDRQDFYLDVPCGVCLGCQKSRSTMWRVRLLHEYYDMTPSQRDNSYFVTLTLSNHHIRDKPSILIRRFLERIRKDYGKSVRHWFTTEFGKDTKRLHFHGILFDIPFHRHDLFKYWKYGFVDIKPLTLRRITYITKYITKSAEDWVLRPEHKQLVFTSPGLGKSYTQKDSTIKFHHQDGHLIPFMYTLDGHVVALPRYYRGKVFTDDELEQMKDAFFANESYDVIPPPPYRIGKEEFTDYTLYLKEIKKIRKKYNEIYKPFKYKELDYGNQPDNEFA